MKPNSRKEFCSRSDIRLKKRKKNRGLNKNRNGKIIKNTKNQLIITNPLRLVAMIIFFNILNNSKKYLLEL
jgi:hypothetical protein